MLLKADKNKLRQKRHLRVRNHVAGTAARPRLNVFRSLAHIYAQIIDDEKGISEVVFDRGGYIYHGRVAALAQAARDGGLKF